MAYDAVRDEVVLFGGCCNPDGGLDQTWTWDGVKWRQENPIISPPGPDGAAMVYDAARRRVILFGGSICAPDDTEHGHHCLLSDDTWTWDGTNWNKELPAASPPARVLHTMAYDQVGQEVVLFGGMDSAGARADTWTWDGAAWTEERPIGGSPPARLAASMAYDTAHSEAVLFGGQVCPSSPTEESPCVAGNDTWTWDGKMWTEEHPIVSPEGRVQASMAYDAAHDEIVLFGGGSPVGALDDTWTWNGLTWVPRAIATISPPARQAATMAYDAARREVLLFGGFGDKDDTWTWDGTAWNEVLRTWPHNRWGAAMTYDAARTQVVLFGGNGADGSSDTWIWDGVSWTEREPPGSPPARFWAAMAYDPKREEVVLHGGVTCTPECYTPMTDTWTWDGTTWTEEHPATSPRPRVYATSMAYDPGSREVVLFGGVDRSTRKTLRDTWTWNGTTWTERRPHTSPPGRAFASMASDPLRGNIVLFGGDRYDAQPRMLRDTWTWNGTTWTKERLPDTPSGRFGHTMAYSPAARQVVLFGGENFDCPNGVCNFNDAWTWDGTTWTRRDQGSAGFEHPPTIRPSHRYFAAMTQDPGGGVLLFGGGMHDGDGWIFDRRALRKPGVRLKVSDTTPRRGQRLMLRVRLGACDAASQRVKLAGTEVVLKRQTTASLETIGRKTLDADCRATFTKRARFNAATYRALWRKQHPEYRRGSRSIEVVTHR